MILYVDDILLGSSDLGFERPSSSYPQTQNFEMKDMGEVAYCINIEIHRYISLGLLGISQRSYIFQVLKRFGMENCSLGDAPIVKGDKFSKLQCSRNEIERR